MIVAEKKSTTRRYPSKRLADTLQSEEGKFVSKEQYWRDYYEHPDFSYEWNNGYLEVRPMSSQIEFAVYIWFVKILEEYLVIRPIATTIGLDTGFEMIFPKTSSIRKPDLGVVLHRNQIELAERDRRYHGIFDICIESVSASSRKEIERDTKTKWQEYQAAGVQEYYILDERGIETAFLENVNGRYRPLKSVDGVIVSKQLPGFQFRLDDLYRRPSLITLASDPVYQGYILPEYQQAQQQAEQERLNAEEERLRANVAQQQAEQERLRAESAQQQAEQERQAKEKLAAKLRDLGVDPTTLT